MRTRYSLARMLREIPLDEALAPKPRRILTQAEIQRRIARRRAQRRTEAKP